MVVIEHRSRRLIHYNVTSHPSAAWTLQQLREAVGYDEQYQFLIHDRDCIFSSELDDSIRALGIRVLKSAPHSPKMNAVCERVIGTVRRECLDWLIPLSASHLRFILKSWIAHYNGGVPICRWVRALRTHGSSRASARSHLRDIVAENPTLSAAKQFSAACIMNTRW
jgi:putative transposase